MLKPKTTFSIYQQRGFKCPVCDTHVHVFGKDDDPIKCPQETCQGKPQLEWDHTVSNMTTVTENKK